MAKLLSRKTLLWIAYGIAVYLTIAFVAYGLAWRRFESVPRRILYQGGYVLRGKVVGLRGFGFGIYRDYFLRISTFQDEIMLPASLLNPILATGAVQNPLILSRQLRLGEEASIRTSGVGGLSRPVALEVIVSDPRRPEETPRKLLDYDESVTRFQATIARSPEIGRFYLRVGASLLPATFGLLQGIPLLLAVAERLRRRGTRASRGDRTA